MDKELIEIKFASDEKEFLHSFGLNKGYMVTHSKMSRCLFLGSDAKQLYTNIGHYAYNGGRESFPGQVTLRGELGWSKTKFAKALNELRDKGFIVTKRRKGNKGLIYILQEMNTVKPLIHSEIVYACKPTTPNFFDRVTEYRDSDLYKKASENPFGHIDEIKEFFAYGTEQEEEDGVDHSDLVAYFKSIGVPETDIEKLIKGQVPTSTGGEVENEPNIEVEKKAPKETVNSTNRNKPKGIELPKVIKGAMKSNPQPVSGGRKRSKVTIDSPIEDWRVTTFIHYFGNKYKDKLGVPYAGLQGDMTHIKRIMGVKENSIIKEQIDAFFDLDFFDVKTIRRFSSNFSQSVLDKYLSDGVEPQSWSNNSNKIESTALDVDEDWLQSLKQATGEESQKGGND